MMHAVHILLLCAFSYVSAVNIYIHGPVQLIDCRNTSDGHMIVGSKQTTQITEYSADQKEFYDAAGRGNLSFVEREISRLDTSGLSLDWQYPGLEKPWNRGQTALYAAAEQNRSSIISALLEAGANPNIQDHRGYTPLNVAAKYNYVSVLRLLLDPKYGADVNLANELGMTPVYTASWRGNYDSLELLLTKAGADPNKVNKDGNSPLIVTSERGTYDSTNIARALLQAGAHINYVRPSTGRTALHQAALFYRTDTVLLLLNEGANRDQEDNDGRTPAELARNRGSAGIAPLIDNYV